jgi:SAM-dependent methyltransferase
MAAKKAEWKRAQQAEADWWRGIAMQGYDGQPPNEFVRQRQKETMLSALSFLGEPIETWRDKVVLEVGSGPAGIVEYLTAARRIAVEPLIDQFRQVFPHLRESTVEYLACPAEGPLELADACADLVICYNMLDHTYDPQRVIAEMSRVCKPGGSLLFQVNVYATEEDIAAKSGLHAELHPFSFTADSALGLLKRHGFEVVRQLVSPEVNDNNEHYLICAARKRG